MLLFSTLFNENRIQQGAKSEGGSSPVANFVFLSSVFLGESTFIQCLRQGYVVSVYTSVSLYISCLLYPGLPFPQHLHLPLRELQEMV